MPTYTRSETATVGPQRFQFSLRRLLIVTVIASLMIGIVARTWYIERAKAITSRQRLKELSAFLEEENSRISAQKRKDTGMGLNFDDEKGIVEHGHRNYDWDLMLLCNQFIAGEARTYVSVKFEYATHNPELGVLRVAFGKEGTENADFETRLRAFLDSRHWPYEIVKESPTPPLVLPPPAP